MEERPIKEFLINESIRDAEIRVIDDNGAQCGVMPTAQAMALAAEKNLDLVMISPTAKPPVCRICNFGKFRYEQMKKEKEAKKNQKNPEPKGMQLSPNIDIGDMQTKAKRVIEFLKDGCVVKISIRLKGRQLSRPENSLKVMQDFFEMVSAYANMDKAPLQDGKNMTMSISPKKQ